MPDKDLHLTFGFVGTAILTQSQLIDPKLGEILGFTDPLSQGPLCDLDDIEAIKNRKLWLQEAFGSIRSEEGDNFIDDNLNLLRKLINTSNKYKTIYLWLGDEANEKITTARLLYYLNGLAIPIYRLNFNKMEFWNEEGVKLVLTSLQVMRVEDISVASQHFEELSTDDKQAFVSLWDRIRTDQSVVHIFDKSAELVSGDETFFDQYLLERCNDQSKRSSLIVGYTLCDIWEKFGSGSVGDVFLFYRLHELANKGKIAISNLHEDVGRAKVVFDVRKVD